MIEDVQQAARRLVARGYRVRRLFGRDENGACRCSLGPRCGSAGKHPCGGVISSVDGVVAERWSGCNLGMMLPHGLVVIDVDRKHGAMLRDDGDRWTLIDGDHRIVCSLPRGSVNSTPSRGWHYYARSESARMTQDVIGRGIETKSGDRVYIVVPPSHGYHAIERVGLPALHDDLERMIAQKSDERPARSKPRKTNRPARYVEAAIERACRDVLHAEPGHGHRAIFIAARSVSGLVRDGLIDAHTVESLITESALRRTADRSRREIADSIRRGLQ